MPQKQLRNNPDASLELSLLNKGYKSVIGIDEVGRGCWAGPVFVGAYIFNDPQEQLLSGVNDSKLVTPLKREQLAAKFDPSQVIIKQASALEIDALGIAKAIEKLIIEIVNSFPSGSACFLIDGHFTKNFGPDSRQIIKGDTRHYAISAASIAAKVQRDALLVSLALEFPGYGFEEHKGYGTAKHLQALKELGVCKLHRKSYKPIKALLTARNN